MEKKFGQGKVDPNKSRAMNEKITDGARGLFEKVTGYVVFPPLMVVSGDSWLIAGWGFVGSTV